MSQYKGIGIYCLTIVVNSDTKSLSNLLGEGRLRPKVKPKAERVRYPRAGLPPGLGRRRASARRHYDRRGLCPTTPSCPKSRGVAQKPTRIPLSLAFLALIGAIVVAPLNKVGAHSFAGIRAAKSQPVAPFDEMRLSENVLIVGSTPYNKQRLNAGWMHRPINQRTSSCHLNKLTQLRRSGRYEKRLGRISVSIFWRDWTRRSAPVDLKSHFPGWRTAAVLPSRRNSEARDVELGAAFIPFGQLPVINRTFGIGRESQFDIEAIEINEGALDFGEGASSNTNGYTSSIWPVARQLSPRRR